MINPDNGDKMVNLARALLPILAERIAALRAAPKFAEAAPTSFERIKAQFKLSAVEIENIGFSLSLLTKMAINDQCDCGDCENIRKIKAIILKGEANEPAEPEWKVPE